MLSKSSKIGQWRILKAVNRAGTSCNSRGIHASVVSMKRRGATSDVVLPDLIIDKQPHLHETLQQKLDRIDYYGNSPSSVNIGYEDSSDVQQNFVKTAKEFQKLSRKNSAENDDELFEELEGRQRESNFKNEDYQSLYRSHRLTEEYQNSTMVLANHYGIFRNLFHDQDIQKIDAAMLEANAMDVFNPKMLRERIDMRFFKPTVPIDVEFFMVDPEGEESETMLCQSVFRGNLIPAEFGRFSPQINIDSSNINGSIQEPPSEAPPSAANALGISLSGSNKDEYYTLAMVNLDSHFNDSGVCHWLVGNIHNDGKDVKTSSEEFIKYLPVYGIRGLGYHRYCFVLFRHKAKIQLETIQDYDLGKRKFNAAEFMQRFAGEQTELKPVGLSWFQTSWSDHCKEVFYKYLDMRSPTYEYDPPVVNAKFKQLQFPGRAPFNLYLDYFRDPKELAKEVLLERLKGIELQKSYDSARMYPTWDGKPILPHIHPLPDNTPDWQMSTFQRKRALVGRYRGLRPASAKLPYNNNADLDNPTWPRISPDVLPINCPNPYPDGKRRPTPIKGSLWSVPLLEHQSLRVAFPEQMNDKDQKELKKCEKNEK